jgi:hypothetical protein
MVMLCGQVDVTVESEVVTLVSGDTAIVPVNRPHGQSKKGLQKTPTTWPFVLPSSFCKSALTRTVRR